MDKHTDHSSIASAGEGSEQHGAAVEPRPGDLRVWWIPQIPMKAFYVPVSSPQEARKLLDVLGAYDDFQFRNRVKPDYSNAGGLCIFEHGEWVDWEDEDYNDIDHAELPPPPGQSPDNAATK